MRFTIRALTSADAEAIAAWRYEPPYDVYDIVADEADRTELLNPSSWPDVWFAVNDAGTGDLAGFLELHVNGDQVEIGLGLRPDLTGQGLGSSLAEATLVFARERWSPRTFSLDVLPWNERAIRAYERAGFERG